MFIYFGDKSLVGHFAYKNFVPFFELPFFFFFDFFFLFSGIPFKLLIAFFTELEQNILKFVWKHQRPWKTKATQRKKNEAGGSRSPDFRLYLKTYSHQNSMVLTQKQDQQNSVEKQTYGQLIYNKGGKNMQWSQDSLFHMSCWENWTALCKRLKLEQFLTPCTKINSK